MDKKSILLLGSFGILFLGVITFSFYRFFIARDYLVSYEVSCSAIERPRCFVRDCDGEDTCVDDQYYYKTIERKPSELASCKGDAACGLVDCSSITTECHEIYSND